jgi:hypothetical protein
MPLDNVSDSLTLYLPCFRYCKRSPYVLEETGQFDTPGPIPSSISNNPSSDERIRSPAVICHLSSVAPLALAHTVAVSIPCQASYTSTPRTPAQYETAKVRSFVACARTPTTSLLHAPAGTAGACIEPCFFPSLCVLVRPSFCLARRHFVVGLSTHTYRVRRPSGVRRAFSSNSRLAFPTLIEACSRRGWSLRDSNWKMNISQL